MEFRGGEVDCCSYALYFYVSSPRTSVAKYYAIITLKKHTDTGLMFVFHFCFISPANNSDESVHTDAGGAFIQSENTGGHLRLCQRKTSRFHQVRGCFNGQSLFSPLNPPSPLTPLSSFDKACVPWLFKLQSSRHCCISVAQMGDEGAGRSDHPRVPELRRDLHCSE